MLAIGKISIIFWKLCLQGLLIQIKHISPFQANYLFMHVMNSRHLPSAHYDKTKSFKDYFLRLRHNER